jgi:hypothetical protein
MENRTTNRRVPLAGEPLSRIRLRTGREMSVLDVGNGGVLVEGRVRLLPGTHLDVHVVTREGRVLVRSRVVRCWVAVLQADTVSYRGALAFDRVVDTAPNGYAFPDGLRAAGRPGGSDYPPPHSPTAVALAGQPSG